MARRATLRASDADREHVAERLRHAAGEGRILAEELEERLEAVFSARTYGELDAVVADLPGTTPARRRERSASIFRYGPLPIVATRVPAAGDRVDADRRGRRDHHAVHGVGARARAGWWVFGQHRRYGPPG